MIRRGFWLVAGAALGITGYRKATRLARTLTSQQMAGPWRLTAGVRAAAGFVTDVREGMADYRDLHGGQLGRSLGSQAGQIASGRSPRASREP